MISLVGAVGSLLVVGTLILKYQERPLSASDGVQVAAESRLATTSEDAIAEEIGVVRMGPVLLDEALWEQGSQMAKRGTGKAEPLRVSFPVANAGLQTAVFNRATMLSAADGSQQWTGTIEGIPYSSAILTRWKGQVYAAIHAGALGEFEWRASPEGELTAYQFDYATLPPCGVGAEADDLSNAVAHPNTGEVSAGHDEDALFPAPAAATEITVVVGYNAQALAAVPGIEAKILTSITGSNQTYANSGIDLQLRLAWMGPVDYVYNVSTNFSTALTQLQDDDDGNADLVTDKRVEYGADYASLWLANSVTGGLASVLTSVNPAFANSVVRAQNPTDTMTHEIGHNQGCRHTRASYGSTPSVWEADGFAHLFVGNNGMTYGTVMVNSGDLEGGTRIPHFSNPAVTYQGVATGIASSAHTSRTLTVHAADYESFRDTVPAEIRIETETLPAGVTTNLTLERAFVGQQYEVLRVSTLGETEPALTTVSTNSDGTATFEDENSALPQAFYQWRQP